MHFVRMAWLNFKGQRAAFNLEEFLLLETLYPFLTLVFYCVMAGYAYQTTDVTDWVIGNAFLLCTNICVFSLGNSFIGERYYGRIRSIMVGSTPKLEIVMQKGFFSGIVSLLTTFVGFACGCAVFGISWKGLPWEKLLIILAAAMFAAMGFGMFLSSVGLVSDQMHLILNLVQYVLLIFTGANFPITQLPATLQIFSGLLPLTRSITAARQAVADVGMGELLSLVAGEIVVGLVYLVLSTVVMKYAEKVAVKNGTLELF